MIFDKIEYINVTATYTNGSRWNYDSHYYFWQSKYTAKFRYIVI